MGTVRLNCNVMNQTLLSVLWRHSSFVSIIIVKLITRDPSNEKFLCVFTYTSLSRSSWLVDRLFVDVLPITVDIVGNYFLILFTIHYCGKDCDIKLLAV